MEIPDIIRKKDEAVTLGLRELFELRGFVQARVNKFEDYGLYLENRNFLASESVITFMDMDGRLKAIKPDVTLSIVKNMPRGNLGRVEKLYYIDEVCRLSRDTREYKMRGQVGVELIGPPDPFTNLEAVDLALESLAVVGGNYVLDISHLGFVSGLLDEIELPRAARAGILNSLHTKSRHTLEAILSDLNAPRGYSEGVRALAGLAGNIAEALPLAKKLILNSVMREAFEELESLGDTLGRCGKAGFVNVDFSVVNHLDYYNGLIFKGYVEGMPDVVLTGGRYDNLMKRMRKESGAIGFAVSLSGLNTYFKTGRDYDFDILITYDENADYPGLLAAADSFVKAGKSVRLERGGSRPGWVCREYYLYGANGLTRSEV